LLELSQLGAAIALSKHDIQATAAGLNGLKVLELGGVVAGLPVPQNTMESANLKNESFGKIDVQSMTHEFAHSKRIDGECSPEFGKSLSSVMPQTPPSGSSPVPNAIMNELKAGAPPSTAPGGMPPTTEEKLAQAEEMLELTLRTGTSMLQQGAEAAAAVAAAVAAVDADDHKATPNPDRGQLTPGMKKLCSMGIRLRNMEVIEADSMAHGLSDSTFINTSAIIAAAGSATPSSTSASITMDSSTFVQHSVDESVAVVKHGNIEAGAGAVENSVLGVVGIGAIGDSSSMSDAPQAPADVTKSNLRQAVVHAANAGLWSLLSYQLDRFWSQRRAATDSAGGELADGNATAKLVVAEFEHADVISALVDAAKQLSSSEVQLTKERKVDVGDGDSDGSMSVGGTSMGSMVNARELGMEKAMGRCMDDSDSQSMDSMNVTNDINPFKKQEGAKEGAATPQGAMSGKVQVQVRQNHLVRVLSVLVELADSSVGRRRLVESGGVELVASCLRARAQQYKQSLKDGATTDALASASAATASPAIVSKLLRLAALMAKQGDAEALLGSSGAITAIVDVTRAFVALELEANKQHTTAKEEAAKGDVYADSDGDFVDAVSSTATTANTRRFVALMVEATSALKFLSFDGQNQTLLVEGEAEGVLLQVKEEYTTSIASSIVDPSEAEKVRGECLQIQRSTDAILRRLRRLGGRGRAGPTGGPSGSIVGNVISIKTTDEGAFKDKTTHNSKAKKHGGQENAPRRPKALQTKQQPKAQPTKPKGVASSMRLSLLKYGRI
jgi:hypothetical protein